MGEVLFWTVAVFAVLGMPLLTGVRWELRSERKEARERERLEESRSSAATQPSGLRRRVGRGRDCSSWPGSSDVASLRFDGLHPNARQARRWV